MTEFIVTGYGRVNMHGISRFEYGVTTISRTTEPDAIGNSFTLTGVYRTKTKIVKRVLRASENYKFTADISQNDDFTPVLIAGIDAISGKFIPAVVSYQSQSYGNYQEITVAISAVQVIG
jgi:hypothetical protein